MRGRTLKILDEQGMVSRDIGSADEYVETLERIFGLALPEARGLWPKIEERHRQLFGSH